MTGSNVNQLRFDISEKVRLHPQQPGIGTLLELDLYPDVEIEDQETHLKIHGYLRLNGTYQPEQEYGEDGDKEGQKTEDSVQQEEIAYVIPVEITLPAERVDMDHIASEIDSFDYQVLSPFELQIEALLTIDGFIQEPSEEKEELSEEDSTRVATFSVPPSEDIRWKQDAPGDSKGEQDEYEFVHVARLEEEEEAEVSDHQEEEKEEVESGEETSDSAEEKRIQAEPEAEVPEKQQEERSETEEEESSISPVHFHPFRPERDREETLWSRDQPLRTPHIGEFDIKHMEEDERTRFGIERMFEEKDSDSAELSSEQAEPMPEEQDELDADPQKQEGTRESRLEWAQWILGEEQERFVKLRMIIVQKNDSIDSLSDRYQVSASKIVRLNRLESEVLEEGQIVYIPST